MKPSHLAALMTAGAFLGGGGQAYGEPLTLKISEPMPHKEDSWPKQYPCGEYHPRRNQRIDRKNARRAHAAGQRHAFS